MSDSNFTSACGTAVQRLDGREKVTGTAPYAFEHETSAPLYLWALQSTIARGRVASVDAAQALETEGVVSVLTHEDAPRLHSDDDKELWILQSDKVHFRGQIIGGVLAESLESAREGAARVRVTYEEEPFEAELREETELYKPEQVNPDFPTDTDEGTFDDAFPSAAIQVDATYTTPMEHNNPMEMHATIATWCDGKMTLYDSTQGAHTVQTGLAPLLGLEPKQLHVMAPYVGGGFGSKGMPHSHNVLACLAALTSGGRPVKLMLTRQQMFSLVGHRTPTIQRIRLGAGKDGRLEAIAHDVIEQTSRLKEFAEQTAVPSRVMYAASNRRTSHRLAALDIPVPSWMRAPGEAPGMFAVETSMDELAEACGLDPIEIRLRNEPEKDPESGNPWSGRKLAECLETGAKKFGWAQRRTVPADANGGEWLPGMGVAASTYPYFSMPGSCAEIEYGGDQCYEVSIGATDIGTGAWTALTQIAADALNCPLEAVRLRIGDSDLPTGTVAGGSSGLSSWGPAIVAAARAFRSEHGDTPHAGNRSSAEKPESEETDEFAIHSFGAQFAEVQVSRVTGEVRVARLLGVFSSGRIINPRTARSQFIGGMTMGVSMALHEHSVVDARFGHVINHDFAGYHIPVNADIRDIDAIWLDEHDPHANPMGSRGIGEIGIVGTAAAISNAVRNATGVRIRDLPITPDKLVP